MTIRRLDQQLGLAVSRVGSSGRTLVTYARDHVSVRTPSRPDFRDGNTLDLQAPPTPEALAAWVDRYRSTVGRLGTRHVQLRWEVPLPADAPPVPPTSDPALSAAAERLGLVLEPTTISLLADLATPPAVDAELVAVAPPASVPGATPPAVERRWHAVSVLDRYTSGDDPSAWRAADAEYSAWAIDVTRELVLAGRAAVWLALRHGTPVARATLLHDLQGLAAIEDVVVHPVHRRLGIAAALTHRAIAAHLAVAPDARIGIGAEPGSSADRLYRRLGFVPHATVWTARRDGDGTDGLAL